MKTALGSVLVLVAAAVAFGCDEVTDTDGLTASGNVVAREYALDDFSAVEAQSAFDVEITRSGAFSVTVRADDNVIEHVDLSKTGTRLSIRVEREGSLRNATLEATITMPELRALDLSEASRATVSGFQSSEPFDAGLSGASSLEGEIVAAEMGIDASGASDVTLSASATDVTVEASGASSVALDGTANDMSIEASGASSLDLAGFRVETAAVMMDGASAATIYVKDLIDPVDMSGASRLQYQGGPELGEVNTSGGSAIDQRDE